MVTLHRAKSIVGWMSDAELSFLAETANKNHVIFEIGSFQGRSTRVLGDNTNGTVYAIDPWEYDGFDCHTDYYTYNIFYCNLVDLIENGRVIPIRSTWKNWIPYDEVDFIFIDGDHRYESVKNDIYKALNWTKKGGIIAGHDYALEWPDVVRAVNEIFVDYQVHLVETIWWVQL